MTLLLVIGFCSIELFGQAPNVSYVLMEKFFPQVVDGNGWRTTFTIYNMKTSSRVGGRMRFFDSNGLPWAIQMRTLAGTFYGKELPFSLEARASVTYETEDLDRFTRQGYMVMRTELGSSGDIQIIATFRQKTPGRNDSEASDRAKLTIGQNQMMPFDNTRGFSTGVAIVNPAASSSPADFLFQFYQPNGQRGAIGVLTLQVGEQRAFALGDQFPQSRGMSGILEIQRIGGRAGTGVESSGYDYNMSIIGLRFNPDGSFSAMPIDQPN